MGPAVWSAATGRQRCRCPSCPWSLQRFLSWVRTDDRGVTRGRLLDAALRQLHAEGHVHERAAICAASFLCFDLGANWRIGRDLWMKELLEALNDSNAKADPVQGKVRALLFDGSGNRNVFDEHVDRLKERSKELQDKGHSERCGKSEVVVNQRAIAGNLFPVQAGPGHEEFFRFRSEKALSRFDSAARCE